MPQELNWWIGGIFAVGAFLFMFASFVVLAPSGTDDMSLVLPDANTLYFAGSIPFTIAAYLQLWQAATNLSGSPKKWIVFGWYPSNPGWLSCALQFAGTLLFNLNTWNGMSTGPGWFEQELWVWSPNLFGSVLFLASGHLAYAETCHAHWGWKPQSWSWWVVAINLVGCIFFMASAIFAFVLPGKGEVLWSAGSVVFTLLGAAAFFIGAILMWPEAKWGSEP